MVYDSDRAEPVCSKCGLVLDEMRFEFAQEFNDVRRRATSNPRTRRISKTSLKHQSLERCLRDAFMKKDIQRAVQDKALELCNIVHRERFHSGYPISILSNALLYTSYKLCRVPIIISECNVTSKTERKRVVRCYEKLCKELKLKARPFEAVDHLTRLCEKGKIPEKTMEFARILLEEVREKRLARGANPVGVAAAAVYEAGNIIGCRVTQKNLAKMAGVSEVTLRASCKILSNLCHTVACHEQRV